MGRASNVILTLINIVTLIISLAIILDALRLKPSTSECNRLIRGPIIYAGILFFIMSFLGMICSCCKGKTLIFWYLTLVFLLALFLSIFAVYVFVVTNRSVSVDESGFSMSLFKERKFGEYNHWLRMNIGEHWDLIKSCLAESRICRRSGPDLITQKLSQLQSSCCKPPSYCGLQQKNATFWELPATGPAVEDSDCINWSNDQTKLCFDCKSCRGGVMRTFRQEWRHVYMINMCLILVLMIMYCIGSCAYRNNRANSVYKYGRRYGGGYP
ncbi:unnamed protein product [Rhodiola kirilowii]